MLVYGSILLLFRIVVACDTKYDAVSNQLPIFKESVTCPALLTTSGGAPVGYNEARVSLNKPIIFNEYFMDSLTQMDRERIPERVVHAKGAGAHGEFIVTNAINRICKAKFLSEVGKKTPVAVRFSIINANTGSADTQRDTRGFAVKFYTEEGIFDLVGINLPVFPLRDPIFFASLAHSQKRNPVTNLFDKNMFWDYLTMRPESIHALIYLLGDFGIPLTYRNMPGFGVHTFEVVNDSGEYSFLKFHLLPNAGIRTMKSDVAKNLTGEDPDYHTRDLYNAIAKGNFPSWNLSAQILTLNEVLSEQFDVFDPTKSLPLDKYPLTPIGRLVLNRNVNNYFAEVEQIAFCPGNLVPGILGSPDKIFESRRLSYRDTQYHRLGANFKKIPVNCPLRADTYNRDGHPPVLDNDGPGPNYYPNSYNGPMPLNEYTPPLMIFHQNDNNNFEQAHKLYGELSEGAKQRLVNNVLATLISVESTIRAKVVKLFSHISLDLGSRIADGLC